MFGVKKVESRADNGVDDWSSYMAAKKSKLEEQYRELVDKEFQSATTLFKGIAIFVNGWTNPCADELRRLMMAHGGVYHNYQRPNGTTHLIASNLPNSKIIQYRKSKNPLPLCKPEWIVDSIKANKLLDWRLYLLYSNTSITQPQLQFGDKINSSSTMMVNENITSDPIPSTSFVSHSIKRNEKLPVLSKSNTIKPEPSMHVKETTKASGTVLCSKNDEFLTEFYNNSRLHHIATMGATFKEYVNELRSKNIDTFHGLARLKQSRLNIQKKTAAIMNNSDSDDDLFSTRDSIDKKSNKESVIMHIDMDCFFVSVGLKKKPELKGLPVAVTHARGNKSSTASNENEEPFQSMAEIASCSYEARKAGLKNGMFLGQALKLCPNLKTIKYDFEGYKEVSYILYNTIASYTLDIEAVSCDELYADISIILYECNLTPLEFAEIIRNEIKEKTGCPVSTGFGSNKLQARLATKHAKPDGQFHLKNVNIQSYIESIKVGDIPGVGYTIMNQLKKMNVHICSDLQNISLGLLQKEFGKKTGEMLYNTCRGIDSSKLNIEHVRKSVSSEVNYGIRFEDDQDANNFLKKLSKEVVSRLTKVNAKGKCITLKLMVRAKDAPVEPAKFMGHGLCDNYTKSKNLLMPTDDETIVTKEVLFLWEQLNQPAHEIRGIGIQISRLETLKKHLDTYMMKFIAKAKQPMSNSISNVTETTTKSFEITGVDKKSQLSNININNNNVRELGKKGEKNLSKHQDFKAFFTAKKCTAPSQKSNEIYSNFPTRSEIDEVVLAELPEDIKMEIVNFHKENTNVVINKEMEHAKYKQSLELEEHNEKNCLLSQEIDESVLRELPLDIRNEILASTKITVNKSATAQSKKVLQILHSQPENYFKQTKPQKCNKTKLPDIEQLDMKVLVELPDDIRNEIMNHYKTNQNNEVENNSTSHSKTVQIYKNKNSNRNIHQENVNNISDELNVSYSQIDPEFLTALSEDMKDDVKMYCMAKKNERQLKLKNKSNGAIEKINIPVKTQCLINNKKRGRKPKILQNNVLLKSKTVIKTKDTVNKINKDMNGDNDKQVMSRNRSFLEHEIDILQGDNVAVCDRRNDIKSHRSSFRGDVVNTDEHQEMLENLVNHLFNLPVRQVKNQIEAWILNSPSVNEIDVISITTFLSMLPKEKRLEDLHILMRTMHRCMTEIGSCVWHETYSRTVEHVQHYMQIQYNSNLMLPPIRCNLRVCKSNHV